MKRVVSIYVSVVISAVNDLEHAMEEHTNMRPQ